MFKYLIKHINSLGSIAIRGLSVLAGFGVTFYIGREMGPVANGQYALVTQTAMFLSIIAVGGIDLAVVREYSAAVAKKTNINRNSFYRTFLIAIIFASIIILGLALGGDKLLSYLIGADVPRGALAVLCVLLVARATTRIMSAVLRSQKSYLLGQTVEVLIIPTLVLIAAVIGLFAGIDELLWGCAIAGFIAAGLGLILSLRHTRTGSNSLIISSRNILKRALPLWGVAIAFSLGEWYGLVTVAATLGVYDAGLYRVALQVASAIAIISVGLYGVFSAQIGAAHAGDDLPSVGRLASSATRLSILLVLPIAIVLFFAAGPILQLIGPEFRQAETVLQILIVGQALFTMTGPSGLTLAMTGHEKVNFYLTLISTILLLFAAPWAAHKAGINGVAVAISALLIGRNLASLYAVYRLVGINIITGRYAPRKVALK